MKVDEIILGIKQVSSNPESIFSLYEEAEKLSEDDREKIRNSGYGESLYMIYSGAIDMMEKGTWDNYVEECKSRRKKTAEEIKMELLEKEW
ncbi:MAG: hypothetical protein PUD93_10025 [Lachnospiraceae bacterium]|nr:hypothetical protein [Lachnospiraceae bacterium]